MKTNTEYPSTARLWLVFALALTAVASALLLGEPGGISPVSAQETQPNPTPHVEATNTPVPTETPEFCPLIP